MAPAQVRKHGTAKPRRVSVNASVDREVLAAARRLGVPVSATLDAALSAAVLDARRAAWLEENREAIRAYNERVNAVGLWSDGLRRF